MNKKVPARNNYYRIGILTLPAYLPLLTYSGMQSGTCFVLALLLCLAFYLS